MKKLVFAALILPISLLFADESLVKGISVTEHDETGHLTRRLKAVSAVGTFTDPKLQDGQVEFFDVRKAPPVIVGVLSFDEAIYHHSSSVIEGDGHIFYRSAQGKFQGDGFNYRMSDHKLVLKSNVVLETQKGRAVSKQGDALLKPDDKGAVTGLVYARMSGGVTFIPAAGAKKTFDRAETESAVYTAEDGMLTLASPITTWNGETKSVLTTESARIFIGFLHAQSPANKTDLAKPIATGKTP